MTEEENVLVPTIVEEPMDFTVVARNPQEMAGAQRSMILWAARKIQAEKLLLEDAKTNFNTAVQQKWKSRPWQFRIGMSEKKLDFYRKIKQALEAGYYIVPPFPVEVFAIRTDKVKPENAHLGWTNPSQIPPETGRPLPAGEGRYVSPLHKDRLGSFRTPVGGDYTGDKEWLTYRTPNNFDDVDFPFKLARPEVMNSAAQAMALKVFDQMGVLPRTQVHNSPVPDPMILGHIFMPHKRNAPLTFFVAWWLDTRTL